jgi:hypothetical protein
MNGFGRAGGSLESDKSERQKTRLVPRLQIFESHEPNLGVDLPLGVGGRSSSVNANGQCEVDLFPNCYNDMADVQKGRPSPLVSDGRPSDERTCG